MNSMCGYGFSWQLFEYREQTIFFQLAMALAVSVLNQKHGLQDLLLFKQSINLNFPYLYTLANNSEYE